MHATRFLNLFTKSLSKFVTKSSVKIKIPKSNTYGTILPCKMQVPLYKLTVANSLAFLGHPLQVIFFFLGGGIIALNKILPLQHKNITQFSSSQPTKLLKSCSRMGQKPRTSKKTVFWKKKHVSISQIQLLLQSTVPKQRR